MSAEVGKRAYEPAPSITRGVGRSWLLVTLLAGCLLFWVAVVWGLTELL